ncbi:MAG TPA: bifunctional nuclease domain-containing protein [Candidatus Binataceae bacterium]|nr:bifunctional nuclease domain-containing protein [Candidatus Binataceae bacterium]
MRRVNLKRMWRRHRAGFAAAALAAMLALCPGCARHGDNDTPSSGQVRVEVANVGLDNDSGAHYVLLEDLTRTRALPILIGDEEARTIMLEMHGIKADRPLTEDLLRDLIEQTGNHVDRVVITSVHDQIYYADIYLDRAGLRLDSRPSDAIALAMGTGAPIFVANGLFQSATAIPHQAPASKNLPATITAQEIVVQDLSPSLARHFAVPPLSGVLVAQVSGSAARAGLMCGDIVTAVDKHPVHRTSDFVMALVGFGDPYVNFSVTRGKQTRTITIERENAGRGGR